MSLCCLYCWIAGRAYALKPDAIIRIMLEQLADGLRQAGVRPRARLALGFSGGVDSLALAHGLQALGFPIQLIHVNHELRPSAAAQANQALRWAERQGLPITVVAVDVRAYAAEKRMNLEAAARGLRYKSLFDWAKQLECEALAVAHQADDQVETSIMNALRGAGLDGLGGMAYRTELTEWGNSIPLVRPFLGVFREEIEAYCRTNGLEPIVDESNEDLTFRRNRIRHELIPALELYNPRIKQSIWRLAELAKVDSGYLQAVTVSALDSLTSTVDEFHRALDHAGFVALPVAIQSRLMRQIYREFWPGKEWEFSDTRAAIEKVKQATHGTIAEWALGAEALGWLGQVTLYRGPVPAAVLAELYPAMTVEAAALEIPGEVPLASNWLLRASLASGFGQDGSEDQVRLSGGHQMLTLRTWKTGDRIRLRGMNGRTKKLSDIFIDAKVPRRARLTWPVVCMGDEIVWLPRLAKAERLAMADAESPMCVIELLERGN